MGHLATKEHLEGLGLGRRTLKGMGRYTQEAGKIAVLRNNDSFSSTIMSDTPMERESNFGVLAYAKGEVLIAGLGLGMIVVPMLKRDSITKIVVVEKEQDVINLVYQHLKKIDTLNKLQIIKGDIHEFKTNLQFDTIYFDIWQGYNSDIQREAGGLKRKFKKNLKQGGWVGNWRL